jgi:hypothetical protein
MRSLATRLGTALTSLDAMCPRIYDPTIELHTAQFRQPAKLER